MGICSFTIEFSLLSGLLRPGVRPVKRGGIIATNHRSSLFDSITTRPVLM